VRDRLTRRTDVVGDLLLRPQELDDHPALSLAPEVSGQVEEEASTPGLDIEEHEIAKPLCEGLAAATRERRELKQSFRAFSQCVDEE